MIFVDVTVVEHRVVVGEVPIDLPPQRQVGLLASLTRVSGAISMVFTGSARLASNPRWVVMTVAFVSYPVVSYPLADFPAGSGTEFYRRYERVRGLYQEVLDWTGIDVQRLLDEGSADELADAAAVCQALLILSTADVLAEHGIVPDVVGGVSIGGLIAAAMAGAVPRADLFAYLATTQYRRRVRPPEQCPADAGTYGAVAIAVVVLPAAEDPLEFCAREGKGALYLVTDTGFTDDSRTMRTLAIGGARSEVEAFVNRLPADTTLVKLIDLPTNPQTPHAGVAPHAPHARFAPHFPHVPHAVFTPHVPHGPHLGGFADAVEAMLEEMTFRAPAVPLLSSLEPQTLSTADDVRALFRDFFRRPVSVPHLMTGLERQGVRAYLMTGPSLMSRFAGSAIPCAYVAEPEDLVDTMSLLYEHGIKVTARS